MKRGFTLVELSIVLVIIGLLIGGILVAQSMIQTAKITRLEADLGKYEVAVNNFFTQYKQYPGDSNLFVPAGPVYGMYAYYPGDGSVVYPVTGPCAQPPDNVYSYVTNVQAFAHLTQSGMIDAKYKPWSTSECGGSDPDDYNSTPGVFTPYTQLDAKASQDFNGNTQGIIPVGGGGGFNIGIQVTVNVWYVLPMEAKMGSSDYLPGVVGLSNRFGVGKCQHTGLVSCLSPNAAWGQLIYNLTPR